jgi:hypothetical protein
MMHFERRINRVQRQSLLKPGFPRWGARPTRQNAQGHALRDFFFAALNNIQSEQNLQHQQSGHRWDALAGHEEGLH